MLENIISESIALGESNIKHLGNPSTVATSLFGTTYSILLNKIKSNEDMDIKSLYKEYYKIIFSKYEEN